MQLSHAIYIFLRHDQLPVSINAECNQRPKCGQHRLLQAEASTAALTPAVQQQQNCHTLEQSQPEAWHSSKLLYVPTVKISEVGLQARAVTADARGVLWYSSLPRLSHTCKHSNSSLLILMQVLQAASASTCVCQIQTINHKRTSCGIRPSLHVNVLAVKKW